MNNKLSSTKILGTKITTASKDEILEYIIDKAQRGRDKMSIVTPNPEILLHAMRHKEYQDLLNRAEVAIPDGIGVLISGRILKKDIKSRITGVDLMDDLCREASERALNIGFLGGRGDVAEKTALCLTEKYPGLIVLFANEEWDEKKIANNGLQLTSDSLEMHKNKNSQKPEATSQKPPRIDILFVAFGFPKQEIWIDKNLEKIPVTVAMGVGGAFDYVSGKVRRAPKIVRNLGFEWAFRLINEPWRAKRQAALPQFVVEVVKERFSSSR